MRSNASSDALQSISVAFVTIIIVTTRKLHYRKDDRAMRRQHLHLRSRDSRLAQVNSTGRYGCSVERTFSPPKFLRVPLGVGSFQDFQPMWS